MSKPTMNIDAGRHSNGFLTVPAATGGGTASGNDVSVSRSRMAWSSSATSARIGQALLVAGKIERPVQGALSG